MGKVELEHVTWALLQAGSIGITQEEIELSSGLKTHIYLDAADRIISHPEPKAVVVRAFVQGYDDWGIKPDRVMGVPQGMDFIVSSIDDILKVGAIRSRGEPKEHGSKKSLEGDFTPEQKVLGFEDILTSGGSTVRKLLLPALQQGLDPRWILGLVDRESGAAESFAKYNQDYKQKLEWRALYTLKPLMLCAFDIASFEDWQIKLAREELGI